MAVDRDGDVLQFTVEADETYGQFDRLETALGYPAEARERFEADLYEEIRSRAAARDLALDDEEVAAVANTYVAHTLEPALASADAAVSVLETMGHDVEEAFRQECARYYFHAYVNGDWTPDADRTPHRHDPLHALDERVAADLLSPRAVFDRYDAFHARRED